MLSLLRGEIVTVIRPNVTNDDLGEPIYWEPLRVDVSGVLVTPGSTADLDVTRPNGVTVSFSLGFPKTFKEQLRGCSVVVRGREYHVIGDPQPYTPENIPGPYNYTVEVTRTDG